MTVTTASAPASAAPDVSAGSSTAASTSSTPAAQPAPAQSLTERMHAKATAMHAPTSPPASPAAKDATTGDAPTSSTGKTDDADNVEKRSDESNVDSKKKAPETVPLAVFKGRLGEEKQKREAISAELHTLKLTASKYEKAVELLQADNDRLKAQLREGRAFSETEEELADTRMGVQARELSAKLQAEHAAALQKITEEARAEEARLTVRTQIEESVATAISKYPLVSADEVYHYMLQDKKARPSPASEIARLINEHKEKQLEQRGWTRAQVAAANNNPVTVSAPSGGNGLGRTGTDRKSMTDFARSNLGHR